MLVLTKDGPKSVPGIKTYIGQDLDVVIEKMEATGLYKKYYSRDGINGHRNVSMIRYGARIEIVAKAIAEEKWQVLDIFVYDIAQETSKY